MAPACEPPKGVELAPKAPVEVAPNAGVTAALPKPVVGVALPKAGLDIAGAAPKAPPGRAAPKPDGLPPKGDACGCAWPKGDGAGVRLCPNAGFACPNALCC